MEAQLSLGEYIRRLRRHANLPLTELQKRTGMAYTHLSRIEADSTLPSADTVVKIAEALDGDLTLMLELAQCLPGVILERIRAHESAHAAGSLKRAAYQDGAGAERPCRRDALVDFFLSQGLGEHEAAEAAEAMTMLTKLQSGARTGVIRLIESLYHEGDDATG